MVWDDLRRIGSHAEWMADAESIEFVGDQREGVGTRFNCRTRVGPVHLTDRMVINEWDAPAVMGVRHEGVVAGAGRFVLEPASGGAATRLTWTERLRFPWWLGGSLGAAVGRPVLRRLWAANLVAFENRFSTGRT